ISDFKFQKVFRISASEIRDLKSEISSHLLAEFLHALLTGDRLTRALAGARVRTGALAACRERATMAVAAVATDVAQSSDVLLNLPTQRAFDRELTVDDANDLGQ